MIFDLHIISRVFAVVSQSPQYLTAEYAAITAESHNKLLELVEAKDVGAATVWVREHIAAGRDTVIAFLDEHERQTPY